MKFKNIGMGIQLYNRKQHQKLNHFKRNQRPQQFLLKTLYICNYFPKDIIKMLVIYILKVKMLNIGIKRCY